MSLPGTQTTPYHVARTLKRERERKEKRIEQLYYRACSGVQIDVMNIGKVFVAGLAAIKANPEISDAELTKVIVAFVNTIREN